VYFFNIPFWYCTISSLPNSFVYPNFGDHTSKETQHTQLIFAQLWFFCLYFLALLVQYPSIIMSSSINIPSRSGGYGESSKAGGSSSSSSSSSYSTSPRTPQQTNSTSSSPKTWSAHYRRPSLLSTFLSQSLGAIVLLASLTGGNVPLWLTHRKILGTSLSKQEHTVINIGDPDGPPRLVSSSGVFIQ